MVYDSLTAENVKFIYSKYLAVKQHFENDYDYWKYNGKVSKNFLNKSDNSKIVYYCSTLYKKYSDIDDLEKLLVLNAFHNNNLWLGSLNFKLYEDFVKFIEGSEYFFVQQVKFLFKDGEYNKKFNVSEEYPFSYVYNCYENGLIKLEVLIILNILTGFLDVAYNRNKDFVFEEDYKKIKKYQIFFEKWNVFSIIKYKKILKNLISENKLN